MYRQRSWKIGQLREIGEARDLVSNLDAPVTQ